MKPASEMTMESLLRLVALRLQESTGIDDDESEASVFERTLRECGLLRLLEAGQRLRSAWELDSPLDSPRNWDAALAEIKQKVKL